MVDMNDYKKPDGGIDWDAYRAAQKRAGERCTGCGAFLVFGKGHPDQCAGCKSFKTERGEVTHDLRVRCPKCEKSWHPDELYAEGEHDVMCPECEHEFAVRVHIAYSFTSPGKVS